MTEGEDPPVDETYDECDFIKEYCSGTGSGVRMCIGGPDPVDKSNRGPAKERNEDDILRRDFLVSRSMAGNERKGAGMLLRHAAKIPVRKRYFSVKSKESDNKKGTVTDVEDTSTDDEFHTNIRRGNGKIVISSQPYKRKTPHSKIKINKYLVHGDGAGSIFIASRPVGGSQMVDEEESYLRKGTQLSMSDAENLISTIKGRSNNSSDKHLNRYVVGNQKPPADIKDVISIEDLRHRTLYADVLFREQHTGTFVSCWIRLVHGTVTCYEGSSMKISGTIENDEYFRDPKTGKIYSRKTSFDIVSSRMLLPPPGRSKLTCWLTCGVPLLDTRSLSDISHARIRRVRPVYMGYAVDVTMECTDRTFIIPGLDLIFEQKGHYFYLRIETLDEFLKWILVYRFRKKRGICKL